MRSIVIVLSAAAALAGLPALASSALMQSATPSFEVSLDAAGLASAVAALQHNTEMDMLGKIVARTAPRLRTHSEAELGLAPGVGGATVLGVVTAPRSLRW